MGRGWKLTGLGFWPFLGLFLLSWYLQEGSLSLPRRWCWGLLRVEAQGDRNLAPMRCPPPAFLHPGPLARWGLPAPPTPRTPDQPGSHGLNFSSR